MTSELSKPKKAIPADIDGPEQRQTDFHWLWHQVEGQTIPITFDLSPKDGKAFSTEPTLILTYKRNNKCNKYLFIYTICKQANRFF